MKKLIAIAVVFALVAGAAFAQTANGISVQAWGRGAFAPFQAAGPEWKDGEVTDVTYWDKDKTKGDKDKGEVYAGAGTSWGGTTRVDFRINGNSDYVGFSINATAENSSLTGGDNGTNIWAKPLGSDILKLTVGTFADETLRGKIGDFDDGFSSFVLNAGGAEDAIFTWFNVSGSPDNQGFLITSAPIDGLYLGLMIQGVLYKTLAIDAWRYMQLGAGYNIANIGHARAQFIGGWSGTVDKENLTDDQYAHFFEDAVHNDWTMKGIDKPARIELAFALTAVDNLLVDLGTKIWLPLEVKNMKKDSSESYNKGLDLSLAATYNFSALGISALGIGARLDIFGMGAYSRSDKDDKSESGATTVIRLVPTYALAENLSVGLNFAVAITGKGKDDGGKDNEDGGSSQVGFGVFVLKGLGNGHIRAGLSYTAVPTSGKDNKANGRDMFQIPIILQYAFF